jgi:acetylglutamate kinase
VDFGATGLVKKINVDSIRERLERDCIVVVSNLGYASSGEILNCKYTYFLSALYYFLMYYSLVE